MVAGDISDEEELGEEEEDSSNDDASDNDTTDDRPARSGRKFGRRKPTRPMARVCRC